MKKLEFFTPALGSSSSDKKEKKKKAGEKNEKLEFLHTCTGLGLRWLVKSEIRTWCVVWTKHVQLLRIEKMKKHFYKKHFCCLAQKWDNFAGKI